MRAFLALFPLIFAIHCLAAPTRPPPLFPGCVTNNITSSLDIISQRGRFNRNLGRGYANVTTNTGFLSLVNTSLPGTFFLLRDGILLAFQNPGEFRGISIDAEPGKEITFLAADGDPDSVPGHSRPFYCARPNSPGSADLNLTFGGDSTVFSLCVSSITGAFNVVYRATKYNGGTYRFSTCFSVKLALRLNPI